MGSLKYVEGEVKTRPGMYNRSSNADNGIDVAGAVNGIGAIPIKATWGPLNKVVKFTGATITADIALMYGATENGTKSAVAFASAGLNTVYVYRVGTGGSVSTITLDEAITISSKYVGARAFTLTVRDSITEDGKKEMLVFDGATMLQKVVFTSTAQDLADAITASNSEYITATVTESKGSTAISNVAQSAMTAGTEPTVTTTDYSKAFEALEPYKYNVLTVDSDDSTVRSLLANYAAKADELGKRFIAVIGTTTSVDFDNRCTEAKSYNSANVCFCGSAYIDRDGKAVGKDSGDTRAVAIMGGYIASVSSKSSVVHQEIAGATDIEEKLTNTDYVKAIDNGLILLSLGSNGQVWFDSGVNTLTNPSIEQDNGWKKIKRVKTRYELLDRMDSSIEPFIGKIQSGDTDTILQIGQKVIDTMVQEGKLISGNFTLDTTETDSAWFSIAVVDADTLEKIYMHYKFRYSAIV